MALRNRELHARNDDDKCFVETRHCQNHESGGSFTRGGGSTLSRSGSEAGKDLLDCQSTSGEIRVCSYRQLSVGQPSWVSVQLCGACAPDPTEEQISVFAAVGTKFDSAACELHHGIPLGLQTVIQYCRSRTKNFFPEWLCLM